MAKWRQTCNGNINEPSVSETSRYAKFWRANKCYYCDIPFATSQVSQSVARRQTVSVPSARGSSESATLALQSSTEGSKVNNTAPTLAFVGALVGAAIGFFMRPSFPGIGQLPLETVVSRGTSLTGLDVLMKSSAEQSFDYLILGAVVGCVLGFIVGRSSASPNT